MCFPVCLIYSYLSPNCPVAFSFTMGLSMACRCWAFQLVSFLICRQPYCSRQLSSQSATNYFLRTFHYYNNTLLVFRFQDRKYISLLVCVIGLKVCMHLYFILFFVYWCTGRQVEYSKSESTIYWFVGSLVGWSVCVRVFIYG